MTKITDWSVTIQVAGAPILSDEQIALVNERLRQIGDRNMTRALASSRGLPPRGIVPYSAQYLAASLQLRLAEARKQARSMAEEPPNGAR